MDPWIYGPRYFTTLGFDTFQTLFTQVPRRPNIRALRSCDMFPLRQTVDIYSSTCDFDGFHPFKTLEQNPLDYTSSRSQDHFPTYPSIQRSWLLRQFDISRVRRVSPSFSSEPRQIYHHVYLASMARIYFDL
jgi:hypothetical protein